MCHSIHPSNNLNTKGISLLFVYICNTLGGAQGLLLVLLIGITPCRFRGPNGSPGIKHRLALCKVNILLTHCPTKGIINAKAILILSVHWNTQDKILKADLGDGEV